MKIQKLFFLFPLLISGCNYPVEGTLEVTAPFALKDSFGHIFELNPGTHIMASRQEFLFFGKGFRIRLHDEAGKRRRVHFKVPKKLSIPRDNGSFFLSASESSQPFDTMGTFSTSVTEGEQKKRTEYCQDDVSSHYPTFQNHEGSREVIFHEEFTQVTYKISFRRTQTEDEMAKYEGHKNTRKVIYDSIGECKFN